jgi:hypothetical protein
MKKNRLGWGRINDVWSDAVSYCGTHVLKENINVWYRVMFPCLCSLCCEFSVRDSSFLRVSHECKLVDLL